MALFDNFGKKVGKVANDAAAKSRELADIARFSVNIADERANVRLLYRDMGEKYYKELRTADLEGLRAMCGKVDAANAKIADLEGKIHRIKGVRTCAACGADSDRKARFCAACGQAMPDDEPVGTAAATIVPAAAIITEQGNQDSGNDNQAGQSDSADNTGEGRNTPFA